MVLSDRKIEFVIDVYLADLLRATRFGLDHAHGGASAIQFNYLLEKAAFCLNTDGLISADNARLYSALTELASEVILIQESGDFEKAASFVFKYSVLSTELEKVLNCLSEFPVDVRLIYTEDTVKSPAA